MKFDLARIFLVKKMQIDAFEITNKDGSSMSREQWLRHIFADRIVYFQDKRERHYVPVPEFHAKYMIGKIGTEKLVREYEPPELGLNEVQRTQWQACLFFLDPSHHEDGQKLYIQKASGVGSGISNFKGLVQHINQSFPHAPYHMELNIISDETTFWQFVTENQGSVTSVSLEIVVPNIFGGSSSYEEEMRQLRDKERARKVKETIENPDGLQPDTERMRSAVSYTARGGGKIIARAKGKRTFDSTKSQKSIEVEYKKGDDVSQITRNALEAILRND